MGCNLSSNFCNHPQGGELFSTSDLFVGNLAGNDGGAVAMYGGDLEAAGTRFAGNSAAKHGGALRLYAGASLTCTGADFAANTASYGGGLYVPPLSRLRRRLLLLA